MSDKTKIEWSDATWNPVTGCSKVSEGCRNCYAKTFTERFKGTPGHYFENGFDVTLRSDKLDQPLRWSRPRRIFVNSMSDLFHPDVPDDFIDQVFAVMALAPQHTFQILTKRPVRMREYLTDRREHIEEKLAFNPPDGQRVADLFGGKWVPPQVGDFGRVELAGYFDGVELPWPLPNVWLGASVENQQAADERIPLLLQTPAAVRFLSCEPLLEEVDITEWLPDKCAVTLHPAGHPLSCGDCDPCNDVWGFKSRWQECINQVIVGGESGPGARPMHPDWARSLRDQCQAAGVAFHFKQWGEWARGANFPDHIPSGMAYKWNESDDDSAAMWKVGKKAAGRLLDGRTWDEFPEVRA